MDKKTKRQRRAGKTRARIELKGLHRLCVHRTPRHIYAQIIAPGNEGVVCLRADDINYTQSEGGTVSTINSMYLEVDANRYVPLAMKIGATLEEGGQSRDITIERYDFSPVSRPCQKGELVDRARRCGRK